MSQSRRKSGKGDVTDFDEHKNFAIGSVATAPSPAGTGLSLDVASGEGTLFPAVPFNAVVFPVNASPTDANAEIVRVTAKAGDTFTITRAQEGTSARAIIVGDRIANAITVKALTDIEDTFATTVLSSVQVLEPGVSGQRRAGRVLALTDFTGILGVSAPAGLWPGNDENDDSGNGRNLSVRGTVPHATGITGTAGEAWQFDGGDDALYHADDAGLSIRFGSWGCWLQTARRGSGFKVAMSKWESGVGGFQIVVDTDNVVTAYIRTVAPNFTLKGMTDVADGRWHWVVVTYDGSVLRIYVDGRLDASVVPTTTGPMEDNAGRLNIGAQAAGAASAAGSPWYGSIQNAFLTPEVLSEDQLRLLYAYKVAHGRTIDTPTDAYLSVRRRRRGGPLATSDFPTPATVDRLHNFTNGALTDAGADGVTLTANGSPLTCPGADGLDGDAYNFDGTDDYLSSTDTGLPSGLSARSLGCWFKLTDASTRHNLVGYGASPNAIFLRSNTGGILGVTDGATPTDSSVIVTDGEWHLAVIVIDDSAADGLRRKLYLDGRLVLSSTTALASTTLAGANGFRVGADSIATFLHQGQADGVFVYGGALTADEIAELYAVGSLSLGVSPKEVGAHVERIDATDVYLILDTLESCDLVDLKVRS
jgi:hypothetical protein